MTVIVKFEGTVKRIYDEQRGQYTHKYVVVLDDNGNTKYPNVLRFKMKPGASVSFSEGAKVRVSAYLDGREWVNPQGQPMYFTDLTVDTIEVLSGSAAPAPSAAGVMSSNPATVTDWNTLLAFGLVHGEDQAAVTSRCLATHPGKPSKTYNAADWQAVAAAIVAAHAPKGQAPDGPAQSAFDDSEMPF